MMLLRNVLAPSLVGRYLLGEDLTGVAVPVARVLGIALVALGVACWPGRTALCGMLSYGAAVTLYLGGIGIAGRFTGILLWPAVVLHLLMTAGCATCLFRKPSPSAPP
ncbi:MAG: hypothetical protein RLZZ214_4214 [Verrucomicrobiota bacterium]|jgi:hypothetical protein